MTSGKQLGMILGRHVDDTAAEAAGYIAAKVSAVTNRATAGIKCTIPSTGETVYVEAAAATDMVDLAINDLVWLKKLDKGEKNTYWIVGLKETAGASHVPPLRSDVKATIDLDDLGDVNAGAPSDGDALTWDTATSKWVNDPGAASVDGVTKTVKAAGGDYTVIQDAINYFQNKMCFGANIIAVDAATYDEKLVFSEILLAPGATLTLQGDARVLAGITYVAGKSDSAAWAATTVYNLADTVIPSTPNGLFYVCTTAGTSAAAEPAPWSTTIGGTTADNTVTWTTHGVLCNQNGLANGGSGFCSIDKVGANTVSVYGWSTSPDFDADGWGAGDKILMCDDGDAVTEDTITSIHGANKYWINTTAGAPTMSTDGAALCLLPDRRLEPTSAGPCITVDGVQGIVIDGWFMESHVGANCDGIRVTGGGLCTVYNTVAKCEDAGFRALQGFSTILHNTGATSAWVCAYGFAAATSTNVDARYGVAVKCTEGLYSDVVSSCLALYCIATVCATGYRATVLASLYATGAAARGCTTGYYAQLRGYILATTTNKYNYGNTNNYSPAATDTFGNSNGSITWS